MADNHSKEVRRINMSHIRSTNSKPEEIVRKYLFSKGFRYRKNVRKLPGCPDIVLPKYRTVIFVNGCFWHRHDCPRFVWPSSNQDYWIPKIQKNVERDQRNAAALKDAGWNVIVVWECELKKAVAEERLSRLCAEIKSEGYGTNQALRLQEARESRNTAHKKAETTYTYLRWRIKGMCSFIHTAVLGVKIPRKSAGRFSLIKARHCFLCIS